MTHANFAGRSELAPPAIPFTRFQLANGLTVVVHEDRKAPIVSMVLWYRVGSGHEPGGCHGFAHLFEHLMFSGSEHYRAGFFNAFTHVGATDINGTTWFDRTNYFVTVPTQGLDLALWMESDRMGHLLGAVGQKELDAQRGIISNEKMEGESRPYGKANEAMLRLCYPEGHPYAHTTIGSMEDLAASGLDDVARWYGEHYGAANATLVLAGDITPEQAREKVENFFGHIGSGTPRHHPTPWIPLPTASARAVIVERVPYALVQRQWNCPAWGHEDIPLLELAASILGGGKTSRLHRRLVETEGSAVDAHARLQKLAVTSPFVVASRIRQTQQLEAVEALLAQEVAQFLEEGPTQEELDAARSSLVAGFCHAVEQVGGMSGKAALLAEGQTLRGQPDARHADLEAMQRASVEDVRRAARQWLSPCSCTLVVMPEGEASPPDAATDTDVSWSTRQPEAAPSTDSVDSTAQPAQASRVDRRSGPPKVVVKPEIRLPALERRTLASGMEIVLARRPGAPITEAVLQFSGGYALEPQGKQGVAGFAAEVMGDGPLQDDPVTWRRRLARLGVSISASSSSDGSALSCSIAGGNVNAVLDELLAMLLEPAFAGKSIEATRQRRLAALRQSRSDPSRLAGLVLAARLYGASHPYGSAGGGLGTEEGLSSIGQTDLAEFYCRQFVPERAQLIVCGDVEMAQLADRFEASFVSSRNTPLIAEHRPAVARVERPQVYILDFPSAPQSVIVGGAIAPSARGLDYTPYRIANSILGGGFEGRLNKNLREDKHWAYGCGSSLSERVGQGSLQISASVQADKTAAALAELISEIRQFGDSRLPTPSEVARVKSQMTNNASGRYETAMSVVADLAGNALLARPDSYLLNQIDRVNYATTLEAVAKAAMEISRPQAMIWVIAGDSRSLVPSLRSECGVNAVVLDGET